MTNKRNPRANLGRGESCHGRYYREALSSTEQCISRTSFKRAMMASCSHSKRSQTTRIRASRPMLLLVLMPQSQKQLPSQDRSNSVESRIRKWSGHRRPYAWAGPLRQPHQLSWRPPPFLRRRAEFRHVRPPRHKTTTTRSLLAQPRPFPLQEKPRGRPAETFFPFHDFAGTGKPPKRAAGLDPLDRNYAGESKHGNDATRQRQLILYP
jgi:hypothetical protein